MVPTVTSCRHSGARVVWSFWGPSTTRRTIRLAEKFSASTTTQQHLSRCWAFSIYLLLLLILSLSGAPALAQNAIVLVGSGSSVPAPIYSRWAQEYDKLNPNRQMRYLAMGTSEGIKQISHGAGDFSAGEAQLTDQERKEGSLIELPALLIAIVPIYNLPGLHQELRLSGEVLAAIFLGDVKTWNAPQITKLNAEIALPSLPIRVVNRPRGKGSNYVFTDFLSRASSRFRAQIGITASPKWPVGEQAERSSDMVEKVRSTAGSIGFVEYQYAVKGSVSQALVLNAGGRFAKASSESIDAACEAAEAPRWNNFSASLANAPGANSFPITSFTWVYLRTGSSDSVRTAALVDFLNWIYTDGQQFAAQEGYAALPAPLLAAVRKRVSDLR
jgi:phosphate transport system substrate-binding protein